MQSAARRTIWAAITRRRGAQGLGASIARRELHLQDSDGSQKNASLQIAAGLLGLSGLGLGSYTFYHISSQQQQQRDGATPGKLFEPTSIIDFFRQKKPSPVDQVGSDVSEPEKEADSVESQGEQSTQDSIALEASDRKSNAEEKDVHLHSKTEKEPARSDEDTTDSSSAEEKDVHVHSKIEKEAARSDKDTTDSSSLEQKEEQLGYKLAEPSSENTAQAQEASLKISQEEKQQSGINEEEPQFEPDKVDLQLVREASEDTSSESRSNQHLVEESSRVLIRDQSHPEQLSGESLTVWNVYCAIKEAVERQKAKDDEILKTALQSQEEKNQMETVKILENCNNTLKSLNAVTEKAVELEAKYREIETELQNALEASHASKVDHAEATIAERKVRLQAIDSLREQLNALTQAFGKRSAERRRSHRAHKLAMGAFALDTAIQNGPRPLRSAVQVIKKAAVAQAPGSEGFYGKGNDELMTMALEAVPEATLDRGVETREKLYVDLQAMKLDIRALSLIPKDGGGFLTFIAAYVVSSLKFEEPSIEKGQQVDRLECALARVETLFRNGHLSAAADILEQALKGTAAQKATSDWIEHVRHRALCEQTLELVRAHSTVLAAALS